MRAGQPCGWVEVKSLTWLRAGTQLGCFPDAVTTRGQKHLELLTHLAKSGQQVMLIFCVQHTGIHQVELAREIDPRYADLFEKATQAGLQTLVMGTEVSPSAIRFKRWLPLLQTPLSSADKKQGQV